MNSLLWEKGKLPLCSNNMQISPGFLLLPGCLRCAGIIYFLRVELHLMFYPAISLDSVRATCAEVFKA